MIETALVGSNSYLQHFRNIVKKHCFKEFFSEIRPPKSGLILLAKYSDIIYFRHQVTNRPDSVSQVRCIDKYLSNDSRFPSNFEEDSDFQIEGLVGSDEKPKDATKYFKKKILRKGFHKREDGIYTKIGQLLISEDKMDGIIQTEHEKSGHMGENRLRHILLDKYEGIIVENIMAYIKTCFHCLQFKPAKEPARHDGNIKIYKQWHTCGIDLTHMQDFKGNNYYVLIAIDFYSRYDERYSCIYSILPSIKMYYFSYTWARLLVDEDGVSRKTAAAVATQLYDIFMDVSKLPECIHSDNGSEFQGICRYL